MTSPSETDDFAHLFPAADDLRGRGIAKWDQFASDVLPCWVADMDFRPAPPVTAAIEQITRDGAFGYAFRSGKTPQRALAESFSRRMKTKFGWDADPDLVTNVSDLVQAVHATILAFSEAGEGVYVPVPNYPPFRTAIATTKRRMLPIEAVKRDGRFAWPLEELRSPSPHDARILVVCNPQNPSGRVLTRAELQQLADFAAERDLIILSDEIHSDLILGADRHIPIASLGPDVAARTITLYSATKGFSIAGLRCGVMHFGSADLRQRFHDRIPVKLLGAQGSPGIDATMAAWAHGDGWLDDVVSALGQLRSRLTRRLAHELPELAFIPPEATYLAWIDCSALGLGEPAATFFLREAKVALSAGETFHPDRADHVRLNFATGPDILDAIIDRMRDAVRRRDGAGSSVAR